MSEIELKRKQQMSVQTAVVAAVVVVEVVAACGCVILSY